MGNTRSSKTTTGVKKGTSATLHAIYVGDSPHCLGEEGTPVEVKILDRIGEGGFSTVYRSRETKKSIKKRGGSTSKKRRRQFAVKRIICKDDDWIVRCEEEINMHRVCSSHPNVLPLLASIALRRPRGVTEYLLLLPLCTRGTLQDAIDRASRSSPSSDEYRTSAFTEAECMSLFLGVCRGVGAMHKVHYSHRDLKPANILLEGVASMTTRPVVMDLGSCARVPLAVPNARAADLLYDVASVHSTSTYRAPELFMTKYPTTIDAKTDVWSLGCLLYTMMFGRSPFEFGPSGSFERLAVMNGTYYVEGHDFLEKTRWRGGSGHGNGDDDGGERKVIEAHVLLELLRMMLCPDTEKRANLEEIVRVVEKKMGIVGFISNGGGGGDEGGEGEGEEKRRSALMDEESEEDEREAREEEERRRIEVETEWGNPMLQKDSGKKGNVVEGGGTCNEFEVEWDKVEEREEGTKDSKNILAEGKKKRKKKKSRKKKSRKKKEEKREGEGEEEGEGEVGDEGGGKVDERVPEQGKERGDEDEDEDEDEFGDFTS